MIRYCTRNQKYDGKNDGMLADFPHGLIVTSNAAEESRGTEANPARRR